MKKDCKEFSPDIDWRHECVCCGDTLDLDTDYCRPCDEHSADDVPYDADGNEITCLDCGDENPDCAKAVVAA